MIKQSGQSGPLYFSHSEKLGMAVVTVFAGAGYAALTLVADYRRNDGEDFTTANFPAFPGQIGCGTDEDEALESLYAVFQAWCKWYLALNGADVLKALLDTRGFEETRHASLKTDHATHMMQFTWQATP